MRYVVGCLLSLVVISTSTLQAEVTTTVDALPLEKATAEFKFEQVPAPSATDAANIATIKATPRRRFFRSTPEFALHDGKLATTQDDPSNSFFFSTGGGFVLFDLGKNVDIKQINSYSWHPNLRAAQVYTVWGAAEGTENLNLDAENMEDPTESGWTMVAKVDTRPAMQGEGGQVGVSIADSEGASVGSYRYVLLDIEPTNNRQRYADTFYTEIDIVDGNEHPQPKPNAHIDSITINDEFEITFDTTGAPELRGWVDKVLKPVCQEWYPKIVEMLPSEGYEAPKKFTIFFRNNMDGVAYTMGTEVHCAGVWFSRNLDGEAAGAVVHEMVHVVQQYRSRRNPGWLVEGLCDYIRWFMYEDSAIQPRVNFSRANYDDSYRTTGAFLNYVVSKHGEEIIPKLNAAMRQDKFSNDLWEEYTGKSAPELWEDFSKAQK
ncbi:basic secretory protein-like protein [Aeoliella mucimassa]|uniref:Plant Basic Secretory Protein n=1 Tax=Aeoliella mucimassa TaxID=2527972 RepID=A0A518AHV9_9BACT|nr:basic secretory protein-like protein [Aeoliella mucimassa]QDU54309.1 Plant Basic Secretory Protein [Aeoliella mucimassa]